MGFGHTASNRNAQAPDHGSQNHTCTENAIQNLAYYRRWGQHRSNLVADTTLGPGVLAYPDVQSILDKFNGNHRTDRKTVIGLITGFLLKADKDKGRISLDPRSCRLVGFFAPIQENLDLPLEMGEEDKVALLCSPENLGAATHWNQRIWNMTYQTKYAQIESQLNNPDVVWNNNKVPQKLLLRIKEITSGDINSRNKDDIQDQQQL